MSTKNGSDRIKTCFVIAPIGEAGSPTRSRSDKVLRHIITPAATECGYEAVRSDRESQPGMIGSQVINHLIDDDLVIADLTGHNPNVFYELAIRHVVRKPIVQIMEAGERLPFDVIQSRTIFVDHTDLDSAAVCREQLVRQILAVESDPSDVDNPITQAVKLKALDQSTDPEEKRDAKIITMLQALSNRVEQLTRRDENNPYREMFVERREIYGGNWHARELKTERDIHNFLQKLREYREMPATWSEEVRANCRALIKQRGAISRAEAAQIFADYVHALASNEEDSDNSRT